MATAAASIRAAFSDGARRLREAKNPTPELDAKLLLRAAGGLSAESLVLRAEEALPDEAAVRFEHYLERRLSGEPVSRILGLREFYGRDFALNAATLDPRPDTEVVVEAALALFADRQPPARILDLGTGSGCLLVTLLAEFGGAKGIGLDLSQEALQLAQDNAERLGVRARADFVQGSWDVPLQGKFDLVVSNPPYIPSADIGGLAPEVREHDPVLALDGGADGLNAYRAIAATLNDRLAPDGVVIFEIGVSQDVAVIALLQEAGLGIDAERSIWRDLAGRSRAIAGFRSTAAHGRS